MATEFYVVDDYVNDNYVAAGIFVDWANKIIVVPRTHLLLIQSSPTEVRELELDQFRLDLKALEASLYGISYVDTHQHNPPVTVGGVTLARVVEIINGYTITFEDGQYAVNIQGGNSNVGDVVNQNQVSVRSANSAGLTYSKEIEDQSFYDARVFIDTFIGTSGTQFPRGTPGDPSDSHISASQIIANRSLGLRFWLRGEEHIGSTYDMSGSDWLGVSGAILTMDYIYTLGHSGPATTGVVINGITLRGSANGPMSVEGGVLDGLMNFEGSASNTGLNGTISIPTGVADDLYTFVDCFSVVPGTATPVIDMNDSVGAQIQFRDYAGGIEIKNCSDPGNILSIDLATGHIVLDSTVTAGTIVIRGVGHVTDNSNGATVITSGLTPVWSVEEKDATLIALSSIADAVTLLQKYEENRTVIDKDNNTLTIYDDDDVTPILTFSLRNTLGVPSTDEVAERVPQ